LSESYSDTVDFQFFVPDNAEEKTYILILSTFYDYDDKDETFGEKSDTEDLYEYELKVLGNCQALGDEVLITADLMSDAQVGKELVILAGITNPDDETSFIIKPSDYESWAELISVEPGILTIDKGNTEQTTIKLKPTKSGLQTFNIDVVYNGEVIEQAVSVNIEEEPTSGFLTGGFTGGIGSLAIYLTAGIFLLLIIIIIVLIVKMTGSAKAGSEF